jgi:hypothetical protein
MSERDHRRQLAVGAGTSPADPGGPRSGGPATSDDVEVDVVQAVAALVGDLVEADGVDGATPPDAPLSDDAPSSPAEAEAAHRDLAPGPEGVHGDAVAPCPDRGGETVGPSAR